MVAISGLPIQMSRRFDAHFDLLRCLANGRSAALAIARASDLRTAEADNLTELTMSLAEEQSP
jgi:hypothetical protein